MHRSVVFFGTRCSFADLVLTRLVDHGITVVARVMPAPPWQQEPVVVTHSRSRVGGSTSIPLMGSGSATRESGIAHVSVADASAPEASDYVRSLKTDIGVVCCYPGRLPRSLFDAPEQGSLNVHPSLLPRNRGPEPLFWIFRNGERTGGVTVHFVDDDLDTGPVVAQQSVEIPLGTPGITLSDQLAEIGASMLIDELENSDLGISTTPQEPEQSSYQSWPNGEDLTLQAEEWDAWRVFHFCRGVIPLGYQPVLLSGTSRFRIQSALESRADAPERSESEVSRGVEWVKCRDGWVLLELRREEAR